MTKISLDFQCVFLKSFWNNAPKFSYQWTKWRTTTATWRHIFIFCRYITKISFCCFWYRYKCWHSQNSGEQSMKSQRKRWNWKVACILLFPSGRKRGPDCKRKKKINCVTPISREFGWVTGELQILRKPNWKEQICVLMKTFANIKGCQLFLK